jgi:ABC-type antimicrobial peptide transport system permease subunit
MHVFLSAPDEPGEATLYVRHRASIDAVAPAIRRAIRDADQRVPVVTLRTLDAQLDQTIWPVRVLTMLLTLFAGGSLLIASIGQYAVVAFDIRRRAREFGLRLALGSSSRQVLESVLREGLRLTVAGLGIGFLLSLATGTGLRGLLYGVTPTDAVTYAAVFPALAAVSPVACYLPARRAATVDPIAALRNE